MNYFKISLLSFICLLMIGCSSSKDYVSKNGADPDIQYTSLSQFLRTKPGLKITGVGEDLTVIIRAERSFFDNNEPLFMLDDVVIGNTYREASSGLDPTGIASVDIITPANAGRFGGRGGNGVIIFRSKYNPKKK